MKLTRVLYMFIILLFALLSLLLVLGHARAASGVGGVPYPTEWNRAWVEIRWPQAPQADDYMCRFHVSDQSGSWFIGEANTWLDYGDAVYTRLYFDFTGSKWFVKDIYCTASRGNELMTSPVNQSMYYLDAINKIVLTLVVMK